ncbi:MAG: hypothetical protein IJD17_00080 [Clostridia bacterium]|nr:hypothetical protein [Clostridia bacterium]
MLKIDRRFENEAQKKEFILECEAGFLRQTDRLCDLILGGNERVVTLSGPTCSGKTVTSNNLARSVGLAGRRMLRISIDDYYRDRSELIAEAEAEGRAPDYDSADSIDLMLLEKTVAGIYRNQRVSVPKYDFRTGSRVAVTEVDTSLYDVVLFEGIQAVYPEFTAMFGAGRYISVATGVGSGITVDGQSFDAREIRLMRRLVRDVRERNTPPAQTFRLWDTTVIPNEEKNILPYIDSADIRIDSLMPYEIHVIRDPLTATLSGMSKQDEYASSAEDLVRRVTPVSPIDGKYIPRDSLYREFIGN